MHRRVLSGGMGAGPWWHGVFPPEFYRYNRVPKSGPKVAITLSGVVFGSALLTFAIAALKGYNETITESVVSAEDKSGQNGWACEMVSKVTDEYGLDAAQGTSFTLVNILENKEECTQSFADLGKDPCASLDYAQNADPTYAGVNSIFLRDGLSGDFINYGATAGTELHRISASTGAVRKVFTDTGSTGYKARRLAYDASSGVYWMLDYVDSTADVLRSFDPAVQGHDAGGDGNPIVVHTFKDGCKDGSIAVDSAGTVLVGRLCYGSQTQVFRIDAVTGTPELLATASLQFLCVCGVLLMLRRMRRKGAHELESKGQ